MPGRDLAGIYLSIVAFLSGAAMVFLMPGKLHACPFEHPIRMAHSGDYVPYQYTAENGDLVGLDVELAQQILAELECTLKLEILPSRRAQRLLASGDIDIMAAASINAERLEYAWFSDPYREETILMFVRKERYDDLKGHSFQSAINSGYLAAAGNGGWYGEEYGAVSEDAIQLGQLVLTGSTEQRVRMLLRDHIDILVADRMVAGFHARDLGGEREIAELPHVMNADPVHFMLSREVFSEQDIGLFNDALTEARGTEAYQNSIKFFTFKPES